MWAKTPTARPTAARTGVTPGNTSELPGYQRPRRAVIFEETTPRLAGDRVPLAPLAVGSRTPGSRGNRGGGGGRSGGDGGRGGGRGRRNGGGGGGGGGDASGNEIDQLRNKMENELANLHCIVSSLAKQNLSIGPHTDGKRALSTAFACASSPAAVATADVVPPALTCASSPAAVAATDAVPPAHTGASSPAAVATADVVPPGPVNPLTLLAAASPGPLAVAALLSR